MPKIADSEDVSLRSYNITQLKSLLERRGMTKTGTKEDLINRITTGFTKPELISILRKNGDETIKDSDTKAVVVGRLKGTRKLKRTTVPKQDVISDFAEARKRTRMKQVRANRETLKDIEHRISKISISPKSPKSPARSPKRIPPPPLPRDHSPYKPKSLSPKAPSYAAPSPPRVLSPVRMKEITDTLKECSLLNEGEARKLIGKLCNKYPDHVRCVPKKAKSVTLKSGEAIVDVIPKSPSRGIPPPPPLILKTTSPKRSPPSRSGLLSQIQAGKQLRKAVGKCSENEVAIDGVCVCVKGFSKIGGKCLSDNPLAMGLQSGLDKIRRAQLDDEEEDSGDWE